MPRPLRETVGRLCFGVLAALVLWTGCDTGVGTDSETPRGNCITETEALQKATERGAISALTNPPIRDAAAANLRDTDRVLALLVGDPPLAVPRALLRQHEILNLDDWASSPLAITYCPLTESSLAFDRSAIDGAAFDVSGLLLHNNLVMVDDRTDESLWAQMRRGAVCGPASGTTLEMVPILDVRWGYWRKLHPDTKVIPASVSPDGSAARGRREAPPRAERPPSRQQGARAPSGPVLGLPGQALTGASSASSGRGALALPFAALENGRPARVVELGRNGGTVVFWRREARAAMAFDTSTSFSVDDAGRFVDQKTGSVWTLDGRAVDGPREGDRLSPVATAYVALWRAWSDFHPETDVWRDAP